MARRGQEGARAMSLLDDILAKKRQEASLLTGRRGSRPAAWTVRSAAHALRRPKMAPLRLVAEIKRRSPSAGDLSLTLSPGDRAAAYERSGASMVSVLTDAAWFAGGWDHLEAARARVTVPLLCKDFVIDPAQVRRAWEAGADAVLLIVRCIAPGGLLGELCDTARGLGLDPFVEVASETELERALAVRAPIVGVNARDIDTLAMDADRARSVLSSIPPGVVAVHLSGLRTPEDAARIAGTRADAALIGEALMRKDDPGPLLSEMVRAVAP
jgi:indole-3-glycerol phosphate synthase